MPTLKILKPKQNKLSQELSYKENNFDTVSIPRQGMIMPNEYNSVSSPSFQNIKAIQYEPHILD